MRYDDSSILIMNINTSQDGSRMIPLPAMEIKIFADSSSFPQIFTFSGCIVGKFNRVLRSCCRGRSIAEVRNFTDYLNLNEAKNSLT
ncbi:hypothetical protein LOK49_LG11G00074 [Camellia lanceoleosa]|uniref:Uncharacterized protein n=1 Tax=Camellia lanceoleosa TaxID=1840588 RepID=A0ACC0FXA2_9ERIC|nr:hypothetical protein LOK49_LG11G00074 [Camellia lanceoleosa]